MVDFCNCAHTLFAGVKIRTASYVRASLFAGVKICMASYVRASLFDGVKNMHGVIQTLTIQLVLCSVVFVDSIYGGEVDSFPPALAKLDELHNACLNVLFSIRFE